METQTMPLKTSLLNLAVWKLPLAILGWLSVAGEPKALEETTRDYKSD